MMSECCPLCGGASLPDRSAHAQLGLGGAPREYTVLLCPACRMRWLTPTPGADDFQTIYDADYYRSRHANDFSFAEKAALLAQCYTQIAAQFKSLGVSEGLLDAGCGRGEFLAAAVQAGIGCEGVEPSAYAASEARKLGVPVWQGTLLDLPAEDGRYAAAYCGHVLEHVGDAHEFLDRLQRLLKPGAPVYLEVPLQFDGIIDLIDRARGRRMAYSDYSIHHHYFFSPKALSRLLARHDFEIRSLTTFLPCRRAARGPGLRKLALQSLLWAADAFFQRGDVISVWAHRAR